MKKLNVFKAGSIITFAAAFLLGSVAMPFLNTKTGVDADSQIDFIKQVKQEGQTSYSSEVTITDTSKPVLFRIYVYNPSNTTYTNGLLRDEFPYDQTGSVTNRAVLDTDQTPAYFSDAKVNLPAGKKLVYKAGSTVVINYNDPNAIAIPDVNGLSPMMTPQGMRLNEIRGGNVQYKHWYAFKADIVDESVVTPKPNPRMEFTKEVKNVTQNSGFTNTVSANSGDILEFRIWVHNAVVGSEAKDLLVKDNLPTAEGQSFVNQAYLTGSNFGQMLDTATVNTSFVGRLEYIGGSTKTFVHADRSGGVVVADENGKSKLFTSGVSLGMMKGCFEFERFVTFKVKVIKPSVIDTPPTTPELPRTGAGETLLLLLGAIPAGFVLRAVKLGLS